MENHLITYFTGEKIEGLLFLILGSGTIFIALWFFLKGKDSFLTGMAYPFMLIALIQIAVGSTIYFRTDRQASALIQQIDRSNEAFFKEEVKRMETVINGFKTYKWIEGAFIVIGLGLFFILKERSFWSGVGLGVIIQGSIMMTFDVFAERRGEVYLLELKTENSIVTELKTNEQ